MSVKSESIVTVPVGGVLELECEAVGGPPPSIKWYHRNNLLQEVSIWTVKFPINLVAKL